MTATPGQTPGQTVGPFFGYALPYPGGELLVPTSHPRAVRLHGTVRDGNGDGIPDALVELWQADEAGRVVQEPGSLRRDGYTFTGFGRTPVDATGAYSFTTLVPGAEDGRAPFFAITVVARGLLNRLFTRAYLPRDPDLLAADPLLGSLPPERRDTLLATLDPDGFRFDLVLQGDSETVFLQYPAAAPRTPRGSQGTLST